MAVDHAIAGAYLVVVLGSDTYHHSRDPNLAKGVLQGNELTSILECERFAVFVSL